jgi:flagellar biosynthesis protein FliR
VIELAVLERFALLLVRPAMVIALAPALGGAQVPVPVKIGLTVMVAIGRSGLRCGRSSRAPSLPVT